jgi:hypothetical protein
MSKHNNFVKFLKKINLSINSLLENYLNKLKFKNLSNITGSNKISLIFVALIILFLSYLSIPHIYSKAEIKKELENQLMNKFSLNFKFSNNLDYKFFPRPHFIINDSSILNKNVEISKIKKLSVFISLDNLFSLKNILVNNVVIENTNFNLNKKSANFFIKLLDNNFLKSTFIIKDSNVFFKNAENEVLFINKILNMKYYYDPKELKNIMDSENEIFNVPYNLISYIDKKNKKIFSKINLNFLKLQIENEFIYKNDLKEGSASIIFNQNKSKATYELGKNNFVFNYYDKLAKLKYFYRGLVNFSPFYSTFRGDIDRINLSSFFNTNSFFVQLLKTEILNNQNLNIDISIDAKKFLHYQNFTEIFFNFKIKEGLLDIDDTKFKWKKYADFKISDSLIYLDKNQLILNAKLSIDIKNDNEIYKVLQISKNLRPKIKTLELNFNYNFDQQLVDFNDVKINSKINEDVTKILKKIVIKDNKLQNKIYFKNIIKDSIIAYVG